ncbi:hypothetical protein NKG05_19555 [Oerskovia sp. M15]
MSPTCPPRLPSPCGCGRPEGQLSLRVGARQEDGYHPLVTIFQAVSLVEEVEATQEVPGAGISLTVSGAQAERVPVDETNLAWRAAESLARFTGVDPDVRLHIHKGVPVAGGMAGGSADAAAALVACDLLWETGLARRAVRPRGGPRLRRALRARGSHRRRDRARPPPDPAMVRGEFHWAFAVRDEGLSTAKVFQTFDEVVGGTPTSSCPTTPS